MRYEEYLRLIAKTNDIKKLVELASLVRRDPDLTDSERKRLLSIDIGRKLFSLAPKVKQVYFAEAQTRLMQLSEIVTPELYEALEGYLLYEAPERYKSVDTLRKRVLPYITQFIEFLATRRNKTLDISDLDVSKLKDFHIRMFLDRMTESNYVKRVINSFIHVFGTWLEDNGYIRKFPKVRVEVPEVPPEVKAERKTGKPRRLHELDRIFSVVTMPTPKVPKERLPIYDYFFRLLLQSGLRPAHALAIRVGDFEKENVDWVEDVFGRAFVKLNFFSILEREMRRKGTEISRKKRPAPYIYLSEELYRTIYDYVNEQGWDYDDPICPISMRALQRRCEIIQRLTGIKDFSMYDFRDTWASVIYNASGHDVSLVVELGGWSSASIPVDVYARSMAPSEAVDIAKKYEIYLPESTAEVVKAIEEGEVLGVKELRDMVERMKREIEELRRKLAGGEFS